MKLTVQIQVVPDKVQDAELRRTVERFNEAANWVAVELFASRISNKRLAQKLVYRELRDRFRLTAQTAILVIHRVCEAYKRDKDKQPKFRKHAAITYDARVLRFIGLDRVNLWTLAGRLVIPILVGKYQVQQFARAKGQIDLVLRKDGKWFLLVTVDVPDDASIDPVDFIGVDLGVKNLATTNDGENFPGQGVDRIRTRYGRIRRTCQKTGTKSAKRKLRKVRKKESAYRRNQNHLISKRIVAKAKDTNSAIACENLAGIGERTTARKPERSRMKGWAFHQLRTFISYKAAVAGIPIIAVDPRDTSRTCPECGHCEKGNRRSRDKFECRSCGHADAADRVGARNIRHRAIQDWATVRTPIVGLVDAGPRNPVENTCKLRGFSPSST